jgi:FAD/FMN-containing dehydrogenase
MANEAFALSPISARAASPTDADFEAIREAFLETARGRWFLDEYTKRNRNADTAMVLEAVARIERSLAAQKEEQSQLAATEPPRVEPVSSDLSSNELPAAMAAVQAIVAAARESVSAALESQTIEDALAPSRKCARVIREIAWGLRESGADGRICSLLDSQVDAINAACDHIAASGFRNDVLRTFDQAARDIEAISPSAKATQAGAEPVAAVVGTIDLSPPPADTFDEPQIAIADNELLHVAVATSEHQPSDATTQAVMLVEESAAIELATVTASENEAPEPVEAAHPEVAPDATPEQTLQIAPEIANVEPALTSLGASLIANGIIAKPTSPRSDPLAPIRRMSQAEKVAFFS